MNQLLTYKPYNNMRLKLISLICISLVLALSACSGVGNISGTDLDIPHDTDKGITDYENTPVDIPAPWAKSVDDSVLPESLRFELIESQTAQSKMVLNDDNTIKVVNATSAQIDDNTIIGNLYGFIKRAGTLVVMINGVIETTIDLADGQEFQLAIPNKWINLPIALAVSLSGPDDITLITFPVIATIKFDQLLNVYLLVVHVTNTSINNLNPITRADIINAATVFSESGEVFYNAQDDDGYFIGNVFPGEANQKFTDLTGKNFMSDLQFNVNGDLYGVDSGSQEFVKIEPDGTLTTVAILTDYPDQQNIKFHPGKTWVALTLLVDNPSTGNKTKTVRFYNTVDDTIVDLIPPSTDPDVTELSYVWDGASNIILLQEKAGNYIATRFNVSPLLTGLSTTPGPIQFLFQTPRKSYDVVTTDGATKKIYYLNVDDVTNKSRIRVYNEDLDNFETIYAPQRDVIDIQMSGNYSALYFQEEVVGEDDILGYVSLIPEDNYKVTYIGRGENLALPDYNPSDPSSADIGYYISLDHTGEEQITLGKLLGDAITFLPLTVIPSDLTMPVSRNFQLKPEGGLPPYLCTIFDDDGTKGHIDPDLCVYSSPETPGTAVIRVTDTAGEIFDVDVTINESLSSPPNNQNLVQIGDFYTLPQPIGGSEDYTYFVEEGDCTVDEETGDVTSDIQGPCSIGVNDGFDNDTYQEIYFSGRPGDFDYRFGDLGIVEWNSTSGSSLFRDIAIQADGKIVAAGYANGNHGIWTFWRFNPDGSPDTSFGINGVTEVNPGGGGDSFIDQILILGTGKILFTGQREDASGFDIAVGQLNSDGTLDTSFGTSSGYTIHSLGYQYEYGKGIGVQSDGKIIVASTVKIANFDMVVSRFHTDGTLDTTFGTSGNTAINFGSNDQVESIAIKENNSFCVAGRSTEIGLNLGFSVACLDANGTLDTNFDTDGKKIFQVSATASDKAQELILQPDGKFLALGTVDNGSDIDIAMIRFNDDGTLDTTFDDDGIVTSAVGSYLDVAYSLVVLENGKIVVVGYYDESGASNYSYAILRYNSDGRLDTSFGTDGIQTYDIDNTDIGYAAAVSPGSQNQVVYLGGYSGSSAILMRFW